MWPSDQKNYVAIISLNETICDLEEITRAHFLVEFFLLEENL